MLPFRFLAAAKHAPSNVASAHNGIGSGAWTVIDGWSENVLRYVIESERNA